MEPTLKEKSNPDQGVLRTEGLSQKFGTLRAVDRVSLEVETGVHADSIALWSTFLSTCAEDHGLCPWMNAQNVTGSFRYRSSAASADFAIGG
jgi:hypothetical protein